MAKVRDDTERLRLSQVEREEVPVVCAAEACLDLLRGGRWSERDRAWALTLAGIRRAPSVDREDTNIHPLEAGEAPVIYLENEAYALAAIFCGRGPAKLPCLRLDRGVRGLHRALGAGLIDMKNFDLEFYEYCDHPAMADLHEIIKNKFVALKGPHTRSYFKDGVQFLAPSHYFELFRKLNVSAVVRLNDEQYPAKVSPLPPGTHA